MHQRRDAPQLDRIELAQLTLWADQAKVLRALGWQISPYPYGVKPVRHSEYLQNTGWLSPGWNTVRENPVGVAGRARA